MVSFVTTNGEPTTTTTSKLVWWNLVDQMTMTLTSCTSAAMLPTRTRASPSRALYKSGSIIVLGKTNFLRPGMDPITIWTATKKSGLISYKKILFHGLDLWTALSLPQPLGRAALWPPHRTIHQHLQCKCSRFSNELRSGIRILQEFFVLFAWIYTEGNAFKTPIDDESHLSLFSWTRILA
ncbi:uncharacterized protein [Zea mays]|uniref:uncharacterized protein n=1 Tax=Zea mays TaxID=4577 RepID=UPI0004DE83A1|nr:uncharacterized protein LOC103639765 [Zea mays]|eukprot:XP_008660703.1 uncharacterized protein LOC103639765 [Zea mays]